MSGGILSLCERMYRGVSKSLFPDVCPACRATLRSFPDDVCQGCRLRLQPVSGPRCSACGGAVDGILEICGECLQGGGRTWDHAVAAFPYGGYIRELIHRFKYSGGTALTPFFARSMVQDWRAHGTGIPDMIVPIPLNWRRQICRGYNQSELLALEIAHQLGTQVARLLRRPHGNRKQAMLDITQRRANVKKVFTARRGADLGGAHILLVDDVLTTGATLNAATEQLRNAGATQISILTLARG